MSTFSHLSGPETFSSHFHNFLRKANPLHKEEWSTLLEQHPEEIIRNIYDFKALQHRDNNGWEIVKKFLEQAYHLTLSTWTLFRST